MAYLGGLEPNPIRRQASLGDEYVRRYKEGKNIHKIVMGIVTKYHPRYNTVDLRLYPRGDMAGGSYFNEGEFSAKLPVGFGGTDSEGHVYGQIMPVKEGSLVTVAFVEGNKETPIVLGVYGRPEENSELSRSPVAGIDTNDPKQFELVDHNFTVFPSLTYELSDGKGNKTQSFTGKSFLVFDSEANEFMETVTDDGLGTDYQDLPSSYYHSGKMINPKEGKAPTILFRHQGDKLTKDGITNDNHSMMWFVGQDGTTRLSMLDKTKDWRSNIELRKDGRIGLRYQKDTRSTHGSKDYNELFVDDKGIGYTIGGKLFRLGEGGGGSLDQDTIDQMFRDLDSELAKKLSEFEHIEINEDGELVKRTSTLEQAIDRISASISKIKVGSDNISDYLVDLDKKSEETYELIRSIAEDGVIHTGEKLQLIVIWEMIKSEFPTYTHQATQMEEDFEAYETSYNRLFNYVDPILYDLETPSIVETLDFVERFNDYYRERRDLAQRVFNGVNNKILEAAEKANTAGINALQALADAVTASNLADSALTNLRNISDDDVITPQEKPGLRQSVKQIELEYDRVITDAGRYEVSTDTYILAYDNLMKAVYDTYDIFTDMSTDTEVNGTHLTSVFEDYFVAKEYLMSQIFKVNKEILIAFEGDFEALDSDLTVAEGKISAHTSAISAIGEDINLAYSYLNLVPGRISMGAIGGYLRRDLGKSDTTYNSLAKNLFIKSTAKEGALNEQTGELGPRINQDLTSNYIQVAGGTPYTATVFDNPSGQTNRVSVAYYDSAFNYLDGSAVSSSNESFKHTSTPPKEAVYARISTRDTENIQLQFEKGGGTETYTYSIQDVGNDIQNAMAEREHRQRELKVFKDYLKEADIGDPQLISEIHTISQDLSISIEEKLILQNEYTKMINDYNVLIAEATGHGLNTTVFENRFLILQNTFDEYLEDMESSTELSNSMTFPLIVEEYLDVKRDILGHVVNNWEGALQATTELLDELSKNIAESEEISREIQNLAREASESIYKIQDLIQETDQRESDNYPVVEEALSDEILTPEDLYYLTPVMDEVMFTDETIQFLLREFGVNGFIYEKAHNDLQDAMSPYFVDDGLLLDHDISQENLLPLWDNYYRQRRWALNEILLSAQDIYSTYSGQSLAVQKEYQRRQEEIQGYFNAIRDSELAIERAEKKIDELTTVGNYRIELTSTNGLSFKNSVINTKLIVEVYDIYQNKYITEDIVPNNFEWSKTKQDGTIDTDWNARHVGSGNVIDITHEDVDNRATFNVDIYN